MASDGDELPDFDDLHDFDEDDSETDFTPDDQTPVDPLADDFDLGDPVVDLANGRNMVIVDRAADRADEWSERNDYDLLGNTGNGRLRARPGDPVFTCVYVADVSSKPTKTYDFPSSRLGRPEYENAAGARVYDLVARDVLEKVFDSMHRFEGFSENHIEAVAHHIAGIDEAIVDEARELAEVEQQFDGGDE